MSRDMRMEAKNEVLHEGWGVTELSTYEQQKVKSRRSRHYTPRVVSLLLLSPGNENISGLTKAAATLDAALAKAGSSGKR